MSPERPTLAAVNSRAQLVLVGINLLAGGLVAYAFYLRPPSSPRQPGSLVVYVALWAAIVALGSLAVGRADREIALWYRRIEEGTPASQVPLRVRRNVLNRALLLALTSFGFWVLAGVLFGALFLRSLPAFLEIAGLAGVLTVLLALPLVDLVWRPIVPAFFPDGHVSEARAFRLPILSRLLLSLLLVSVYPTGLLAVSSLTHAEDLIGAAEPLVVIRSLIAAQALLVAISVAFAAGLALAVTRSIISPLSLLEGAVDRVAAGDLSVALPVTTNDEVGHVTERFNEMVVGLRRGEEVRRLLDQYVSPEVARQAVESGAALGGRAVECTALFCDLRGFTELSGRLPAQDLVAVLNTYMSAMVDVVVSQGGIVNKFGGDSLLAIFGAPVNPAEDHAARALRAARAMRGELDRVNRLAAGDAPRLRMGIGVATGPAVAGHVGGPGRLEYTIIGEAVNLAARLQDKTKEVGHGILVDSRAYAAASAVEPLEATGVPPLAVAGIAERVVAWAL